MLDDEKLTNEVNRSGFPLQLRVENIVRTMQQLSPFDRKWNVIYTEHSWKNPFDGDSGFIDVVLLNEDRVNTLVVECKRVKDATWIFINDCKQEQLRSHAKAFVSETDLEGNVNRFDWEDLTYPLQTYESKYCVVSGQDGKSRPMLERVAAELVSATEALANEELVRGIIGKYRERRYFNVIVTTATIKICSIDPAKISITDGSIDNDKFAVKEVPYLRFRKQLSFPVKESNNIEAGNFYALNVEKENTVFIVNSLHLEDFLRNFTND